MTGAGLVLLGLDASVPDNWGFRGYFDLLAVFVATPGLVVARHQPRNAIGWLLLVAGLSAGFSGFAQEYSTRAVLIAPGSLPGAIALAWLASWSFSFFVAPLLTLIPQLFPTGRPLGPRWKPLQWCGVAVPLLMLFLFGLSPGPLENATFIENPLGPSGALADTHAALQEPLNALLLLMVAASGFALAVRFRRARGAERQQLKWVVSSVVVCTLALAGMLGSNTKASQILMNVAVLTLPVAIGIAITRYRLYDIDVLINRTLVYAATSAGLVVTYAVSVIALGSALRPLTGSGDLAVAGSTLVVVALFAPLRSRIQRAVDQRFYRFRYDAARTLEGFGARLRDEVDLDDVRADLLEVVHDTVRPAHASVWLRPVARFAGSGRARPHP